MAFDDPIVYPGQPGRSHLHAFFGNTGTSANSTAASIASSGNSTCRGGTANRTAYWVPAMIDTKDGTPVAPDQIIVYYKVGYRGPKPSDVVPLPQGLRMIAGDPTASAGVLWGPVVYKCDGVSPGPDPYSIPNCAVGHSIWANVTFPQCWDGVNLDSPDHRSHMAYFPIPSPDGKCPASHPIALPEVAFNVVYTVNESDAPLRWRLSSDVYDKSLPGGYSFHGDWFNGWKADIMSTWVRNCDDASKDCLAHLLGDGRMMGLQ